MIDRDSSLIFRFISPSVPFCPADPYGLLDHYGPNPMLFKDFHWFLEIVSRSGTMASTLGSIAIDRANDLSYGFWCRPSSRHGGTGQ